MSMSCQASSESVRLSVRPDSALVDDPVAITLSGLQSGQRVTVQAMLEEDGVKFGSAGHYLSDQSGEVDLTTNPSLGGTYVGVEPMGLFWSMKLLPGELPGLRLLKRDVTTPYRVQLAVREGYLPWEELWALSPAALATTVALRYYKAESVSRREIEAGRVRGTLFVPPGSGPFPGVIDMFGTAGGLLEFRAALLASRGFATFALPYFNYKDLPKTVEQVDFGYFLEAADWFCSLPEVQPGGIGVGGVSKGGELSLMLAAYCPQISACVNITGPPHTTGRGIQFGDIYLPGSGIDAEKVVFTEEGIVLSKAFWYKREHVTPLVQSRAKFLVLLAEDDCCYSGEHIKHEISLLPAGKQRDFEVITYPGAGHLLEPPYAPHCRTSYYSQVVRAVMEASFGKVKEKASVVWGGRPQPHSVAQEHSWARILHFYREHVGYNSVRGSKL